jgi:hypothetical protein
LSISLLGEIVKGLRFEDDLAGEPALGTYLIPSNQDITQPAGVPHVPLIPNKKAPPEGEALLLLTSGLEPLLLLPPFSPILGDEGVADDGLLFEALVGVGEQAHGGCEDGELLHGGSLLALDDGEPLHLLGVLPVRRMRVDVLGGLG